MPDRGDRRAPMGSDAPHHAIAPDIAAAADRAPTGVPVATDSGSHRIVEVVHSALLGEIGPRGPWTLARRASEDATALFDELVTASLAREIAAAILANTMSTSSATSVEEEPQPTPLTPEDRTCAIEIELSVFDPADPLVAFIGSLSEPETGADIGAQPVRFVA